MMGFIYGPFTCTELDEWWHKDKARVFQITFTGESEVICPMAVDHTRLGKPVGDTFAKANIITRLNEGIAKMLDGGFADQYHSHEIRS